MYTYPCVSKGLIFCIFHIILYKIYVIFLHFIQFYALVAKLAYIDFELNIKECHYFYIITLSYITLFMTLAPVKMKPVSSLSTDAPLSNSYLFFNCSRSFNRYYIFDLRFFFSNLNLTITAHAGTSRNQLTDNNVFFEAQ